MTDNIDNLVLEHLRHIRARVDQTAEDVRDLKFRFSALETPLNLVRREVVNSDENIARQQVAIDRLDARLQRVERRLELREG